MGTTRIKVIDLSSKVKEIKTSRKRAEKLAGVTKLKEEKPATTESTEKKTEATESVPSVKPSVSSVVTTPSVPSVIKTQSKVARKHKRHLGKKYQQAAKLIDKNKSYPAKVALELLSQTSITSFDPTVEVHLNVADKNLKISVNFPHPIGGKTKRTRYLIFSDHKPITESTEKKQKGQTAKTSSVPSEPPRSIERGSPKATVPPVIDIIWADQSIIADIENGKLKPGRDFDACLAQPKFMPALAKIAKILGPRGLMPNPKNGTISQDPQKAIGQKDDGAVNLALDPTAPILHTVIGKLSAKPQHLSQNLAALILAVGPTKIKKATIKSTMGPGIKVDLTSINQ